MSHIEVQKQNIIRAQHARHCRKNLIYQPLIAENNISQTIIAENNISRTMVAKTTSTREYTWKTLMKNLLDQPYQ